MLDENEKTVKYFVEKTIKGKITIADYKRRYEKDL